MSPAAQVTSIGLAISLLASAWLGQKTVDDWTQGAGRKPMIQGKGRWSAYMRANRQELPTAVAKRLSVLTWICYLAFLLIIVVITLDNWHGPL